ncbi:cellulose synthase operon protein YhjQ/BcsQ [Magnetospirillum sp. UT-4]|uniref:AAA family ATPase n=1 Tax=Magnetospirillum sp. UT-4 TaxID=2681467 RepID=UPI0013826D95|nr:cellulose synthase operon protein YhjQ/BcsQ [Magnetospirillum sp. UT-4]CAA7625888.1 Pilus assembly protein cpaE [Magnetospirillum sp. UT-4]
MICRATIDAFTLTPAFAEAVARLAADSAFAMARIQSFPGGLAAAVAEYGGRSSPQVVIVEEDDDDAALCRRLDQLAELCEPGTRVIVVGQLNDIRLYRTLMAKGVSEYLVAPVAAAPLAEAVAALFADPAAAPRGKVMAFWGVRGGAGASTLAQNTAHALGGVLGEAALYVDLDLAFGTSLLAFNIDPRQTVADALAAPERMDPVLLERLMVPYGEQLRVLAAGADPRQAAAATLDGVDRLLELCSRMAPVVVVDLPRLWCDWTGHVLAGADEVVAVAQADLASLREAKTLLDGLSGRRSGAAPKVVLNKLDCYRKTQLSPKDFTETLGAEPALALPFEPQLFGEAANNGQMLAEAARGHKVVEQVRGFAERLSGRTVRETAPRGNPLLRLLAR